MKPLGLFFLLASLSFFTHCGAKKKPARAEVLFLGNEVSAAQSDEYASMLAIKLFKSGINITFTSSNNDLNRETLGKYDALIIYGKPDSLSEKQASDVINF